MKYSNQIKKNVVEILKVWTSETLYPGKVCARNLLYKYQFSNTISGIRCKMIEFQLSSLHTDNDVLILLLNELINTISAINEDSNDCHTIRSLAVNGHDLKKLGVIDKDVGEWLHRLLELVMSETVDNESDDLLNIVMLNS